MKWIFLLFACTLYVCSIAQTAPFPKNWTGNWKGELQWYKTGTGAAQKVPMTLRIHPTDNVGTYTWQLIYGSAAQDNRPYLLIPADTTGTHWIIDEKNGILLDQYWVGNKLCGAFTVMGKTIINSYRVENDKMIIEFYSIGSEPIATTGDGTDEIPRVDSYHVGGYQQAVLKRQ